MSHPTTIRTPASLCSAHFVTLFIIARRLVVIQVPICFAVDFLMNWLRRRRKRKSSEGQIESRNECNYLAFSVSFSFCSRSLSLSLSLWIFLLQVSQRIIICQINVSFIEYCGHCVNLSLKDSWNCCDFRVVANKKIFRVWFFFCSIGDDDSSSSRKWINFPIIHVKRSR